MKPRSLSRGERQQEFGAETGELRALLVIDCRLRVASRNFRHRSQCAGVLGEVQVGYDAGIFREGGFGKSFEAAGVAGLEAAVVFEQDGDLGDVHRGGDLAANGFDQRFGFANGAHLFGKWAQDRLSVVGIAEEAFIDPDGEALHADVNHDHGR